MKKVSVNGGVAWREGAARSDNPLDSAKQRRQWDDWNSAWAQAERHFNGFRNMQEKDA